MNILKKSCLVLCGFALGCVTPKCTNASNVVESVKVDTLVVRDTIVIKDTVVVPIPVLSKEAVLRELERQNIPHAKIVLAQSLLETGHYKSGLCKTHNNIFGLRKGSKYRRYNNYIECIADYKRLISSRYKGGDYFEFLERIHYAENGSYTKILKSMIQKL